MTHESILKIETLKTMPYAAVNFKCVKGLSSGLRWAECPMVSFEKRRSKLEIYIDLLRVLAH
jgi:hypothetical protein